MSHPWGHESTPYNTLAYHPASVLLGFNMTPIGRLPRPLVNVGGNGITVITSTLASGIHEIVRVEEKMEVLQTTEDLNTAILSHYEWCDMMGIIT